MRTAEQLRPALPGYVIEDNAYDIGYWARITGFSRPTCPVQAKGWDVADAEKSNEANYGDDHA